MFSPTDTKLLNSAVAAYFKRLRQQKGRDGLEAIDEAGGSRAYAAGDQKQFLVPARVSAPPKEAFVYMLNRLETVWEDYFKNPPKALRRPPIKDGYFIRPVTYHFYISRGKFTPADFEKLNARVSSVLRFSVVSKTLRFKNAVGRQYDIAYTMLKGTTVIEHERISAYIASYLDGVQDAKTADFPGETGWVHCGAFPLKEIQNGHRACRKGWRDRGEGNAALAVVACDGSLGLEREYDDSIDLPEEFADIKDMLATDWLLEISKP